MTPLVAPPKISLCEPMNLKLDRHKTGRQKAGTRQADTGQTDAGRHGVQRNPK